MGATKMKLVIPDEYLDTLNDRTGNMIQQSLQRWGPVLFRNRVFDSPMHMAAHFGCREYKRKDWRRIAFISGPCLDMAVAEMLMLDGQTADTKEVLHISRTIRLAAGRYLSYDGGATVTELQP